MKSVYKYCYIAVIGSLLCLNASAGLTNGLVLNYTFDPNTGLAAKDSSPYGNDGQLVNANVVSGQNGNGVKLNGIDAYIRTPVTASLMPEEITLAAWVKFGEIPDYGALIFKRNASFHDNEEFQLEMTAEGTARMALGNGGWQQLLDSSPMTPGRWHHVAATFAQPEMRIYVDGQLEGTAVYNLPLQHNTESDVLIGCRDHAQDPMGHFFDGQLDEVRIYNRALTAEEIRQLAASDPNPAALTQGYHVFDVKIDAKLLGQRSGKNIIDKDDIQGLLVYNGNTAAAQFFDIARNEIIVLDADFTYDPRTNHSVPKKGITAQGVACAHIHIDGFLDAVTLGSFRLKRTINGKLMTISLAGAGADAENDAYGAVLLRYNQTISNAMNLAEDAEATFRAILLKRTGIDILGNK